MRELAAQVQPGIWDEYKYAVYEILYLASRKTSITGTSWEDERGKKTIWFIICVFLAV